MQSHLHLDAIQELVYRRLGLSKEVDLATGAERQLFNRASFDRVHEIVATEGAVAFVRELRVRSTPTASAPSAVGAR